MSKGDIEPSNKEADNETVSVAESEESYETRFGKDLIVDNIIFLHFNPLWQYIVILNITALYVLQTYDLISTYYDVTYHSKTTIIRVFNDVIFGVDIVVAVAHRFAGNLKLKRDFKPRNIYCIIVDSISLLSFDYVYGVRYSNTHFVIFIFIQIFRCMRTYRIFVYLVKLVTAVGHNNWIIMLQKFAIIMTLLLHSLSCVWFITYTSDATHIINSLNNKWLLLNSALSWYCLCCYFVGATITSMGFGDVYARTDVERCLSIFGMVAGFVLFIGIFLGALTSVQVENNRHRSVFRNRLTLITKDLHHRKVSKEIREKMINFYSTFWQAKLGIISSNIFNALPLPMRQEVYLDQYWEALNVSKLFRDLDVQYKRAVASVMHTKVYMSGDIILREDELKTNMFYIVRGMIHILSKQDNESPIMSLTVGSCLCETGLLLSYSSSVHLQAACYCELQILEKTKLCRIMLDYPGIAEGVHAKLKENIYIAMESQITRKELEFSLVDSEPYRALKCVKDTYRLNEEKWKIPKPFIWLRDFELGNTGVLGTEEEVVEPYRSSKLLKDNEDDICVRTKFPWILQPNSTLITSWETIVVIAVLIACFLYPYYAAFKRSPAPKLILILMYIIYTLDIYLELTTAVEVKGVSFKTLKSIFKYKIIMFSFILDILALLPIETIAWGLHMYDNERFTPLIQLNKLIKIHKVLKYFKTLENSFILNNAAVHMITYVVYLLIGSYWMGIIFYMQGCFEADCDVTSWFAGIIAQDVNDGTVYKRFQYEFAMSLYFGMSVMSNTGFGDATASNMTEMCIMFIFFIVGLLLFSYLVSDYSATLILSGRSRIAFMELVFITQKFLQNNAMLPSIQDRVYRYLSLQWEYRRGYFLMHDMSLFFDAPEMLRKEIQAAKRWEGISSVPLFQDVDPKIIYQMASRAESYILPPNEVVTYAGEMCREFYIIEEGFCEEISGLTGEVIQIMGPRINFCVLEMLLEISALNTVRTVTHSKLTRISFRSLQVVLSQFENLQKDLHFLIVSTRESGQTKKLPARRRPATYEEMKETSSKSSWCLFELNRKKVKSKDYYLPFRQKLGVMQFFRFVLLRRTILPASTFIMWSEGIRSFCAILSGMFFPVRGILIIDFPGIYYICLFLTVMAVIDIYIRMHVAFYNTKGLLVTHPASTAIHYITHSFLMDFIVMFPITIFRGGSAITKENARVSSLDTYMCLNSALQIYRLPLAFAYRETDILRQSYYLVFLKYIPLCLVSINVIASILCAMTFTLELNANKTSYTVLTSPGSWITKFMEYNVVAETTEEYVKIENVNAFRLHVAAYYWVATTTLSVGFGDITPYNGQEMIFCIVIILLGYLLFTYMVVRIASSKASVNMNLTQYQERMRHLISFMNSELVSKTLQAEIINHFEHVWQRTRGMKARKTFNKFHVALREDALLYLYDNTFKQVQPFAGLNQSFFRRMGTQVQENYFLRGATITKANDIIKYIYIIHKGAVSVVSGGVELTILGCGSMFGNIDNYPNIRSKVTVTAIKHLDLLVIPTTRFYILCQDYPKLTQRIQIEILNNQDYISSVSWKSSMESSESKEVITTEEDSDRKGHSSNMFDKGITHNTFVVSSTFMYRILTIPMMFCSCASVVIISYHLAFQDHNLMLLIFNLLLDLVFLMRIYLGFHTAYENDSGEIIENLKDIKNKYMSEWSGFYLDLVSSFPISLFCLLFPRLKWMYALSWLRTLHLLRAIFIVKFFNIKFERLNVNMFIVKLASIVVWFTLMTHFMACVWFMIVCHHNECDISSWANSESTADVNCHNQYVCSVYFIITVFTFTGFGDIKPQTMSEIFFCTGIMIFAKFAIAVFIGDMSGMVANYTYTLVNYDYETNILRNYLKESHISNALMKKVLQYVELLWYREYGNQVPDFIHEMPGYLLRNFKEEVYGKHVFESSIFNDCNMDFQKQIIMHLRRVTYFAGNFITQQGDVNNTMYFIHKGDVEVLSIDETTETLTDILHERDIFGLMQGLYEKLPHTHTFRALTVVVLLTLNYREWHNLLHYFPESYRIVYRNVGQMHFIL